MKKILVMLALTASFLAAINVQKASKDELMCIKGIGEKKAAAIIKYRKTNKLKSAKDLLDIKGFGDALVNNVQKDTKSVACGGKASKKSPKKKPSDKESTKKTDSKKESKKSTSKKESKKSDSKKESKKSSSKKSDSKKTSKPKKESKKSDSKKSSSKKESKKSEK